MPLPPSSAAPAARSQLPSQAGEDSSCFVSPPVYGEVPAQRLLPQGMGVCQRTTPPTSAPNSATSSLYKSDQTTVEESCRRQRTVSLTGARCRWRGVRMSSSQSRFAFAASRHRRRASLALSRSSCRCSATGLQSHQPRSGATCSRPVLKNNVTCS